MLMYVEKIQISFFVWISNLGHRSGKKKEYEMLFFFRLGGFRTPKGGKVINLLLLFFFFFFLLCGSPPTVE